MKTPISHPPKTPNLPPPRGGLTHRHKRKKYFILCHYFLFSFYSFALLTWLFRAVVLPLFYLFSFFRKSSFTYFLCSVIICSGCSLFISYSYRMMFHVFLHSSRVIHLFLLLLHFNHPSLLCYFCSGLLSFCRKIKSIFPARIFLCSHPSVLNLELTLPVVVLWFLPSSETVG